MLWHVVDTHGICVHYLMYAYVNSTLFYALYTLHMHVYVYVYVYMCAVALKETKAALKAVYNETNEPPNQQVMYLYYYCFTLC